MSGRLRKRGEEGRRGGRVHLIWWDISLCWRAGRCRIGCISRAWYISISPQGDGAIESEPVVYHPCLLPVTLPSSATPFPRLTS